MPQEEKVNNGIILEKYLKNTDVLLGDTKAFLKA